MALPPLELFSLEGKGRLLPGGLFVVNEAIKQQAISRDVNTLSPSSLS